MYDQMFLLYDLDESGLIDSHEEIHGLFMNTWFKLLAKSEISATNPPEKAAHYIATLKQVLANGNFGFTQYEWAQWFESNVYLQNQAVQSHECAPKAQPIIIPEEREAMYDKLFLVYDLDESGLIDSHEEIHALFTNTWFKCRSDSDIHLPASQASQYMATLDQVLVNGHRGFTQHEWAQWFESNVYLQHQVVDL